MSDDPFISKHGYKKYRPPIRNVETPVSYTKNSVLRYVSFTNWPYARQTDLKLIVVIVMLTRYVMVNVLKNHAFS